MALEMTTALLMKRLAWDRGRDSFNAVKRNYSRLWDSRLICSVRFESPQYTVDVNECSIALLE